jgi:7,8-dihydroneopterin aldolase/epimerase/oxygenase
MSTLEISAARLHIRLGCGAPERAAPQDVDLRVTIRFGSLPHACESDELGDTVCYAKLVEQARELCAGREFKTVEHLAYAIARRLRGEIPADAGLEVRVTKLHPPIEELDGGVSFTLSL